MENIYREAILSKIGNHRLNNKKIRNHKCVAAIKYRNKRKKGNEKCVRDVYEAKMREIK